MGSFIAQRALAILIENFSVSVTEIEMLTGEIRGLATAQVSSGHPAQSIRSTVPGASSVLVASSQLIKTSIQLFPFYTCRNLSL